MITRRHFAPPLNLPLSNHLRVLLSHPHAQKVRTPRPRSVTVFCFVMRDFAWEPSKLMFPFDRPYDWVKMDSGDLLMFCWEDLKKPWFRYYFLSAAKRQGRGPRQSFVPWRNNRGSSQTKSSVPHFYGRHIPSLITTCLRRGRHIYHGFLGIYKTCYMSKDFAKTTVTNYIAITASRILGRFFRAAYPVLTYHTLALMKT